MPEVSYDPEVLHPEVSLEGWITLKEYLRRTGETAFQVHSRLKAGKWQRRIHYSHPDGGAAFVNALTILAWILEDKRSIPGMEVEEIEAEESQPAPLMPLDDGHSDLDVDPAVDLTADDLTKIDNQFTPITQITTHDFKAWVPQLLTPDDGPDLYANLTGMDLPAQGHGQLVLGPFTADHHKARQFVTKEDCDKWCEANSQGVDVYFSIEKAFSVPL